MLSQVNDTAHEGIHWAEIGVTATAEADDFAADPIFLVSESETHKRCRPQLCCRSGGEIEASWAYKDLHVL